MSGDQLDTKSKDSVKDGIGQASEDSGRISLGQGSEKKSTTINGTSPVSTSYGSSLKLFLLNLTSFCQLQ